MKESFSTGRTRIKLWGPPVDSKKGRQQITTQACNLCHLSAWIGCILKGGRQFVGDYDVKASGKCNRVQPMLHYDKTEFEYIFMCYCKLLRRIVRKLAWETIGSRFQIRSSLAETTSSRSGCHSSPNSLVSACHVLQMAIIHIFTDKSLLFAVAAARVGPSYKC